MTVYVVSHHEGLVAVADTRELADRVMAGFVAKWRHLYGKPWIEEITVQTEGV